MNTRDFMLVAAGVVVAALVFFMMDRKRARDRAAAARPAPIPVAPGTRFVPAPLAPQLEPPRAGSPPILLGNDPATIEGPRVSAAGLIP